MALTDNNEIIDINLEGVTKQRFRINGDSTAIIELNLSDLGILDRLESGIDKLQAEMTAISEIPANDEHLTEKLKAADARMRETVDYIFDYPVSAVCARGGTMYDPKDGMFRYERIIDGLTKLYKNNINEEYKKFKSRIQKHTDKYTKSSKKKKSKDISHRIFVQNYEIKKKP